MGSRDICGGINLCVYIIYIFNIYLIIFVDKSIYWQTSCIEHQVYGEKNCIGGTCLAP